MEVVAAIVILGLVAVSSMTASSSILWSAERARQNAEGDIVATRVLSEYEMSLASGFLVPDGASTSGTIEGIWASYDWSVSVDPVTREYRLWAIDVEVEWPTGSRRLGTRVFLP